VDTLETSRDSMQVLLCTDTLRFSLPFMSLLHHSIISAITSLILLGFLVTLWSFLYWLFCVLKRYPQKLHQSTGYPPYQVTLMTHWSVTLKLTKLTFLTILTKLTKLTKC